MLYLLPMKIFMTFIILVISTGLALTHRGEAGDMQLPVNRHHDEGLQASKESADLFHSHEFQDLLQREQLRLKNEVFSKYTAPWKKKRQETGQAETQQSTKLSESEKIYLFFSSSVPDETMRNYITALVRADDPNIVPVMRGWVSTSGDNRSDVHYFSRILQRDPACSNTKTPCSYHHVGINLEPSLFSKYAITRVPAVVYETDTVAYLIRGDSGLDYMLEKVNREAGSPSLTRLIQKIRGRH